MALYIHKEVLVLVVTLSAMPDHVQSRNAVVQWPLDLLQLAYVQLYVLL